MIIYPAIDVIHGKCVRLSQGRFSDETVYSDSPLKIAEKWQAAGAKYIHVVDLDGARAGESKNFKTIAEIASMLNVPVQTGGGIRSMETVEKILGAGIQRVILGTSAVKDRDFVEQALLKYPDRVAIGIDAKNGMVAIEGWEKTSDFTAIDFAIKMEGLGAKTIIYTDIARDGMLSGPNLKGMEEMTKALKIDVIASGGVSRLKDIENLRTTGVKGVIVGKALYTGAVELARAIELNG